MKTTQMCNTAKANENSFFKMLKIRCGTSFKECRVNPKIILAHKK